MPSTIHPRPLPDRLTEAGRTLVMGVVNVTPDSFSDGGQWFEADAAIAHGTELLALGADILDVGGESTRPGAPRVSVAEELERVLPVIDALGGQGAIISIDTTRAEVATAAVAAGAMIINDVSGGRGFGADVNEVTIVDSAGETRGQAAGSKDEVSDAILDQVRDLLVSQLS